METIGKGSRGVEVLGVLAEVFGVLILLGLSFDCSMSG